MSIFFKIYKSNGTASTILKIDSIQSLYFKESEPSPQHDQAEGILSIQFANSVAEYYAITTAEYSRICDCLKGLV